MYKNRVGSQPNATNIVDQAASDGAESPGSKDMLPKFFLSKHSIVSTAKKIIGCHLPAG